VALALLRVESKHSWSVDCLLDASRYNFRTKTMIAASINYSNTFIACVDCRAWMPASVVPGVLLHACASQVWEQGIVSSGFF
jgi:hypothetical protein